MRSQARAPEAPVRTMEEFSLFVGLSRPTVSRFFNDPAALKATTRRRIEAALEASGFRPNLLAANLVRRRSNIVGVVVPDAADPFYAALTRRVQAQARLSGFQAFVLSSDGDPVEEAHAVGTLSSMSAAGAIVAPLGGRHGGGSGALERLHADIPIVYVDSPPDGPASFVGTDNRRSFAGIVAHLCATGTPPRFLGMPAVNSNAADRAESYAAAMRAEGFDPMFVPLPNDLGWDFERFGFEAADALIRRGEAPGATILCASDRLAFGALAAAFAHGLAVGREGTLRIAGHDDHPLSRYTCPPLTTVAQDYDRIGRCAVEILLRRIAAEGEDEPAHETVLLETHVVARRSA